MLNAAELAQVITFTRNGLGNKMGDDIQPKTVNTLLTGGAAAAAAPAEAAKKVDSSAKLTQQELVAKGESVYNTNCASCHQEDGAGLAKLYPPLLNSDFIKNNPLAIDSIIKNGQNGPIVVNGVNYNMAMPSSKKLSDFEIKQIASYVLIKFNKLDSLLLD
jgi:cytochrome c oxidase subunit 2